MKTVLAPLNETDKKDKERSFHNEVNVLSNFRHPNIVKLLAYSLPPDTTTNFNLCLVFELLSAGTLDKILQNDDTSKRFTWEYRLTSCMEIASALIYLHGNAVYHRDVKSANIALDFIEPEGRFRAVLLDCGLSKYIPEEKRGTLKSSTGGRVFGTPGYICESYGESKRPYDPCCEIVSFGAVIGELLSGKVSNRIVEKSKKGSQLFMKDIISRVPVDPRVSKEWPVDCVSELRELAIECLKPYDERLDTMHEVLQKLRAISEKYLPSSIVSGLQEDVLGVLLKKFGAVVIEAVDKCHMDTVEDVQTFISGMDGGKNKK